MEKIEFINAYKRSFVTNTELKVRFEMGKNEKGNKRVRQVLERFKEISEFIFQDEEIWVLLVIWDANGQNKKELLNSGFDETQASEYYHGHIGDGLIRKELFSDDAFDDAEILYLKYQNYSFSKIRPIVYSKAAFELGFKNTAGIVAYFMSFKDKPILLNLYDDRGMEVLSHDNNIISAVERKFSKYIKQKM